MLASSVARSAKATAAPASSLRLEMTEVFDSVSVGLSICDGAEEGVNASGPLMNVSPNHLAM